MVEHLELYWQQCLNIFRQLHELIKDSHSLATEAMGRESLKKEKKKVDTPGNSLSFIPLCDLGLFVFVLFHICGNT